MQRRTIDGRLAAQLGLVAVVTALAVGAAARLHPWNSDDVALQVAMRTWSPGHGTLYLPEGTWLLRLPLDALTQVVFGPSAGTLALQTVVLNVAAALMVFWFVRLVVSTVVGATGTRWSVTETGWFAALVTCWTFTLSPVLIDNMMRPNSRNIEVGLTVVGVVLAVRRLVPATTDPLVPAMRRLAVPALWFGVLAIDDPTAIYSIMGLAGLVAAVVLVRRRSQLGRDVLVLAAGSVVVWRIGLRLLGAAGVSIVSLNPRVIQAAELPTTLATTTDSLARTFDVPILGETPAQMRLLVVVPQLALLVLTVVAVVRHRSSLRRNPWVVGAATWAIGLLTAFTLSSHGLSTINVRYVVFGAVPIAAVLAAGVAADDIRPRRVMVALMVVVAGVHGSDSLRSLRTDATPNRDTARLVEALSAAGIHRGYGDFWDTLGPSYFDERLRLVPVACDGTGLTRGRRWFQDDSIRTPDPTAERTAYIDDERPGLTTCSLDQVTAQFGAPNETIHVTDAIAVLVYTGDIGTRFAPPAPPG